MPVDLSRLTNPWLRDFLAPSEAEAAMYRQGTTVPQYAALAAYNRRTGVSLGPARMLFEALSALPNSSPPPEPA